MFSKTAIVILTLSLVALVKGTPISDFSKNVESSLENLKGVNCLVEAVINLDDAADEFSYKIKNSCGSDAVDDLSAELDATKELLKITEKINSINEKACDNAGYDEEQDADETPSDKCVKQLKTQMAKLLTSFNKTKKAVVNGLNQSYSSGACVKTNMSNFRYFLNSFPARIEVCGGLNA